MIITQTNKQANKQITKKTNNRNRLCKKQTYVLIQGKESSLMNFVAVSAKTLKTVKYLPNIFLNIDIMDLYLLSCFCILFGRRLESVQIQKSKRSRKRFIFRSSHLKVFFKKIILKNLKNS